MQNSSEDIGDLLIRKRLRWHHVVVRLAVDDLPHMAEEDELDGGLLEVREKVGPGEERKDVRDSLALGLVTSGTTPGEDGLAPSRWAG